jgi:hypothetical protein
VKQVLYYLSHISVHFVLVILEMGVSRTLPGLASNQDPPDLSLPRARFTGMGHQRLTFSTTVPKSRESEESETRDHQTVKLKREPGRIVNCLPQLPTG